MSRLAHKPPLNFLFFDSPLNSRFLFQICMPFPTRSPIVDLAPRAPGPAGNPTMRLINPVPYKHAPLSHICIHQHRLFSLPHPPPTLVPPVTRIPPANARPSLPCRLPMVALSVMFIRTSMSRGWSVSEPSPRRSFQVLGQARPVVTIVHDVPSP